MIQDIFCFIHKCLIKILKTSCNQIFTIVFKYILWINNVKFENGLIVNGALPSLWKQYGKESMVQIGKNVIFNSFSDQSWYCKCKIFIYNNAKLAIGDYTGFNGVMIYCSDNITIGNYVKIGGGTRIFDTDHHPLNYECRRKNLDEYSKKSGIVIKDDVFIGTNCIICKGVTIGERTIIAAGSVVVKSIPANCIAGGNPCKIIKYINDI